MGREKRPRASADRWSFSADFSPPRTRGGCFSCRDGNDFKLGLVSPYVFDSDVFDPDVFDSANSSFYGRALPISFRVFSPTADHLRDRFFRELLAVAFSLTFSSMYRLDFRAMGEK